jgi:hypothetical protein
MAACTTTLRQHPEFHGRIGSVDSVAVAPAEARFVRLVFAGDDEELHEPAGAIAERLPGLIAERFRHLDFEARALPLGEETYSERPELRFEATLLDQSVSGTLDEMYRKPKRRLRDALRYERSIGPEINRFADLGEADALVFARFRGFEKSAGEVARNVIVASLLAVATLGNSFPLEPPRGAVLEVCIVDGTTGEVLWANSVRGSGDFLGDGLDRLVGRAFEPFAR